MSAAREAILARIGDALGRSQTAPPPPAPRDYRLSRDLPPGSDGAVDLFADRLVDYKATVHRVDAADLPTLLARLLAGRSVVVPAGLPEDWAGSLADVRTDSREAPLGATELDGIGAVLTAARVAIAESGTIVLDGEPDQGRRAISLVPDHHVCVVRREQVVATVPEAVAVLGANPTRPLTWIAGPSATSDIELERVEGVHGPRRLEVVVVS